MNAWTIRGLLLLLALAVGGSEPSGYYMNPVMLGDFSDLDAIRVGSDYYAISSTLQYSPGRVSRRQGWSLHGE